VEGSEKIPQKELAVKESLAQLGTCNGRVGEPEARSGGFRGVVGSVEKRRRVAGEITHQSCRLTEADGDRALAREKEL